MCAVCGKPTNTHTHTHTYSHTHPHPLHTKPTVEVRGEPSQVVIKSAGTGISPPHHRGDARQSLALGRDGADVGQPEAVTQRM